VGELNMTEETKQTEPPWHRVRATPSSCDVTATVDARCGGRVPSDFDVNKSTNDALGAAPWPRSVFLRDAVSTNEEASMLDNDEDQFETLPDGRKILKDGGRLSFGLMAMDSADDVLKATLDDMGNRPRGYTTADAHKFGLKDSRQLHRPGFRYAADPFARDAALIAYADRDAADADAWKGNPPVGQGSMGFVEKIGEGEEGDSCTVNGNRGTLQRNSDGELICVPD
jgi:hypothetical protein